MRNADEALAASGEHFTQQYAANRERRRLTMLMQRLWQENHFTPTFEALFGVGDDK